MVGNGKNSRGRGNKTGRVGSSSGEGVRVNTGKRLAGDGALKLNKGKGNDCNQTPDLNGGGGNGKEKKYKSSGRVERKSGEINEMWDSIARNPESFDEHMNTQLFVERTL
ncbi:hypothetical protein AALP_AAs65148U000100 [Arabis alpina]|uniref:Uncharacterized protein n=1 Tax=Arabis alpina TaxID=50452 RepID=A0A087FXR8_ARAAL|nr:hypothetical protein AALP_AAs65148U000100 [Arabis alpina]